MPKLTRDVQFQKAFQVFFDEVTENHCPELQEYTIESITENKNLAEQDYVLHIPREVPFYHIDVFVIDRNGIVHPPGTVMRNQEIPTIRDFKTYVLEHFETYYLIKNNKNLSYVRIEDFWYEKGEHIIDKHDLASGNLSDAINVYDLKVVFRVVYFKSHFPFHVTILTKQQIEQKCKNLEVRNHELCVNLKTVTTMYQETELKYDILRRKMRLERRNIEQKYKSMMDKMQKKVAQYYDDSPNKDDCPVCYELIPAEKLKMPGCCHAICNDCASRCSNCPICRETY